MAGLIGRGVAVRGRGCRSRPTPPASQRLAMLALLVVMVVSFSPTMTAAVITDSGARGRLSDTVLAMVVLADLVHPGAVLGVDAAGALRLRRWRPGRARCWRGWRGRFGGAVAFGVAGRRRCSRSTCATSAARSRSCCWRCAPCSARSARRSSSSRCWRRWPPAWSSRTWRWRRATALRAAVRRGAPPVLVVFFVAVGASLRLDAVAVDRLAALALSVVRLGFIRLGVNAGAGLSGLPDSHPASTRGPGLVSQAGITLGFASVVAAEFPGWGSQVQLLLVASIAIHELVGPILFRRGLAEAGELDTQRAAPAGGRVEPRAVPAQPRRGRPDRRARPRPAASRWRSTR